MWLGHVLKTRDVNVINVRHLWKYITRGVIIIFLNNQRCIDIVRPICYSGNVLS